MYFLQEGEWVPAADHTLVMEDDVTKVQISKKDITTKEELPGASLELYDEEDGSLVEAWVSTEEAHYIEKLPAGTYRLVEKKAPEGYGYAEDVIFEVKDTGEIQTVEMLDDIQPEEDEPDSEIPEEETKDNSPDSGDGSQSDGQPGPLAETPSTGDTAPIMVWLMILTASAGSTGLIWIWSRKRKAQRKK